MAFQAEGDRLIAQLIFLTRDGAIRITALFRVAGAVPAAAFEKMLVLWSPQRYKMPDKMGAGAAASF